MTSGPEAATAATEAAGLGPSSVLADTRVLIWYVTAPRMLEQSAAAGQPIVIASVSLIELVYIAEKRSEHRCRYPA